MSTYTLLYFYIHILALWFPYFPLSSYQYCWFTYSGKVVPSLSEFGFWQLLELRQQSYLKGCLSIFHCLLCVFVFLPVSIFFIFFSMYSYFFLAFGSCWSRCNSHTGKVAFVFHLYLYLFQTSVASRIANASFLFIFSFIFISVFVFVFGSLRLLVPLQQSYFTGFSISKNQNCFFLSDTFIWLS